MKIKELLNIYIESDEIKFLHDYINDKNIKKIKLNGLIGSSAAIVSASTCVNLGVTNIFIFGSSDDAQYFYTDMQNLFEIKQIQFLPSSFRRSFQPLSSDNNLILERAEVLNRLIHRTGSSEIIISTIDALSEYVLSAEELTQNTYEIKVGDKFDLEFFIEFLNEHNFDRSDFVYEAGQYSIRGGIIDIFSFSNDLPYRVELNDDVIEAIRTFDPTDQLSVKKIDRFYLIPNVQKNITEEKKQSFFDYIPKESVIWINNYSLCKETFKYGLEKLLNSPINSEKKEKFEETPDISVDEVFCDTNTLFSKIKNHTLIEFGSDKNFKAQQEIEFNTKPQPAFNRSFQLLIENLKQNTAQNLFNLIFSDSSRQVERLYSIFDDIDKDVRFQPIYHALSSGFIDLKFGLACYTEHQIFNRFYKSKSKQRYSSNRILTLRELSELRPGDFVTHIDHGVGKFAGLEKIEISGRIQEAVRLIYKNNDLLYVSINSLHKISKYVGKEGTEPTLNKLGSDTWEKLKTSTKKKVKDIARDLIKLYAKRKASRGFAFAPDTYMQVELEASFIYEDTPDQFKATQDVKSDMEKSSPMDRLVCGDVGFGKTEVAIRAAFKSVSDSKQVAILVPTTILANQHYRTFKDRLKDFPCNIEYINRFKSTKEQKDILQKTSEGKIDILIGTHKLLSKEIKFRDLGLLIIDEEQKFGVSAKEKLKNIKTNVDTLTLTATPIPRTLHFSLMGARDLSIINTPPANRQAVTTELHNFNSKIIHDAIMFEISRGGQVFFVHHRVKDIYDVQHQLQKICPGINVGVAHGQLEGSKLEDEVMKFIEGEYDVLLATTIIESGLDISNANTIIINNAQMFGLSDLHQMRGRVGRSNKKAFCYLMVPQMAGLSSDARRRLQAIEEFSDLGSGFNVAMRDLDIRGAGNLLGGEQSGFIAEIGFEMYHKILDEAIKELKQDEFKDLFEDEINELNTIESSDCLVETDFQALIPDDYVRNIGERLSLYSQLSKLTEENTLNEFEKNLADRFGKVPEAVLELIEMIKLREAAKELGFEKVILKNDQLAAVFPPENKTEYYQSELFSKIIQYVQGNPHSSKLKQTAKNLTLILQPIFSIKQAKDTLQKLKKFTLE